MKSIAIDIGNTKTAAALFEGGRVLARYRDDASLAAAGAGPRAAAVFDWVVGRLKSGRVDGVVIASVVPAILELWTHLWAGKPATRGAALLVVSHESPLPFALEVDHPETVGADRLCNVAGARSLDLDTAIVVDLGTANTYDVLDRGRFVGGLIGPGCERSHRELLRSGAQLPDLPFGYPPDLLGKDTRGAIAAGSFHQAVGGVAHVVYQLWDRFPQAPVVLTGGVAEMIGPELPFSVLYHRDLTLEGAAAVGTFAWTRP